MWSVTWMWKTSALIFSLMVAVFGDATETDFLDLYNSLLGNYSRNVRPLKNQTSAMILSLQFDLLSLSELNDVKQRISALVLVSVQWHDKNLIWNPDHYGSIDRMYFSGDQIWAPKVFIQESPTKEPTLFNLPTTHLVLPDGTVTFSSSGIIETSCCLDVTYFPFDFQSCTFAFGVLDSSRRDAVLVSDPRGPQKSSSYVEDGEWTVLEVGTAVKYQKMRNYEAQTLDVIFKFQRRSTYYVLNVIIPVVTVSFLSLLTFAVPVESGERLLFSLTILLSLSVYITYIGTIMPSSSMEMPVILRYLVCLFLISSVCVVVTVVVIVVRWSRVVVVSDQRKCIFIFGFPIIFQRRGRLLGVLNRSLRNKQLQELKTSGTNKSVNVFSCELQNLCRIPDVIVDDSTKKNFNNSRSAIPNHCVPENGRHALPDKTNLDLMIYEDTPTAVIHPNRELGMITAGLDLDVFYICSRLDLICFLIILILYLVLSAQTFLQLHQQIV